MISANSPNTAAPILSRLQRFDFKRIGPAEIRERLSRVLAEESIVAEPEALAAIARAADGSMRDALSITDQVLSMGDGRVTAEGGLRLDRVSGSAETAPAGIDWTSWLPRALVDRHVCLGRAGHEPLKVR